MRLVDVFIRNPVKVAVGVILVVLFGLLTVTPPSVLPSPIRVPVQLTPNVDQPLVTVSTFWEGASPEEVEREIVDKQEETLKGISNLRKMTSTSSQGSASILLEFEVGSDPDVAKQDVSDALRRVKYQIPQDEFDNPTVKSGPEFGEDAIAWMILSSDREDIYVPDLYTFVDEQIKPMLERVDGVSSVRILGGREREIQVVVDPFKLAQAGVTFGELQTALQTQNTNVAAGNSAQGKRDIVIRTMGRFGSLDDIRKTVVRTGPGGPIRVERVAEVVDTFKKQYGFVRSKGRYVMAIPAYRKTGSNVLETMEGLKDAIRKVNAQMLSHRGLRLDLTQVYDETTYIKSSISLVRSNILFGGLLALVVLVLFLRSFSATLIVAIAIPISVIGTFLIIPLAGRNINVVMLAGLAFAVGMVVDNAIVVLENIYRHREMGKSRWQAASDGAAEVWGAVLANSLTTMVVFLPIIFVKEEAGQLFRDIAIAISGAIALSLLVSVMVIPPLAARLLRKARGTERAGGGPFARGTANLVRVVNRRVGTRLLTVLGLTAASILLSVRLAPEPSYLPSGNKNLIFGFLLTPPGYNTAEFARIGERLENGNPSKGQIGIRSFWEAREGTPEYARLLKQWSGMVEGFVVPPKEAEIRRLEKQLADGSVSGKKRDKARRRIAQLRREIKEWRLPPPPIENFFFVSFNGGCFMGCSSADPDVVRPLKNVLNSTGFSIPDSFAIFFQPSIFKGESGNTLDIEVRGEDLAEVVRAGQNLMAACAQKFGRVDPNPRNFFLDRREDQLFPDRVKAGDLGLNVADIGSTIRACGDGRVVGQYREGGRSIDLTVKVADTEDPLTGRSSTDMIARIPIYTPTGKVVPLSSVCRIKRTTAPQEISHIETQPAVKLTVHPPEGVSLPQVIHTVNDEIVAPMRAGGYGPGRMTLPPSVNVALAGNADKLQSTWDSLKWLLALSLLVVYLLMAGLFESFAYPFVIILTVPLAVVGGFIGLGIVHAWTFSDPTMAVQDLDILTILGFVILLGIVVNNGILIVHQSLNFVREGLLPDEAIPRAVQTRIRPIFMSILTTFFGQLLLVVRTGSGAELYRGVGAVVLGGLLCSTLFTLVVVPAMLSLFMGARIRLGRVLFHPPQSDEGAVGDVGAVVPGVARAAPHAKDGLTVARELAGPQ
ncbi:MAG: efflux RND transporter permease subunit [Phycisphaerae bacterium]